MSHYRLFTHSIKQVKASSADSLLHWFIHWLARRIQRSPTN